MANRPPAFDRQAYSPARFAPIETESDAQSYGWNVHSLAGARADRERQTWEEAIATWQEPARPSLAEIMDSDPDGKPAA